MRTFSFVQNSFSYHTPRFGINPNPFTKEKNGGLERYPVEYFHISHLHLNFAREDDAHSLDPRAALKGFRVARGARRR